MSSIRTTRSSSGRHAVSALSSVVFPVLVPPLIPRGPAGTGSDSRGLARRRHDADERRGPAPDPRASTGRRQADEGAGGYREVGCGTLSCYVADGERLTTVRMARMPESKKATLKSMLSAELSGSPDIKVGRSPGRSDQELCDLGRNRLIHGFFWDLPEQYFLASVDGRLRRPRSGWGACSAAAKSRRKVFNLWLLLDDRWAGDTAQVEPVR